MKLKELLTEDAQAVALSKDYFGKFKVSCTLGGNLKKSISRRTSLIDPDGKFMPDIATFQIMPKLRFQTFYWPFGDLHDIRTFAAGDIWGPLDQFVFKNFNDFPNGASRYAIGGVVDSFAGIEKLTSMTSMIVHIKHTDSGLLRLLKIPNLKTLQIGNEQSSGQDKNLVKALKIVMKHLEHKDLIKCQDDLIDAGFEEYAKL